MYCSTEKTAARSNVTLPRETSPGAKSEEKRMFSQAKCNSFLLNEFVLQDILTDFSVEAEKIPLDDGNPNEWFGHKVHVQKYIVK